MREQNHPFFGPSFHAKMANTPSGQFDGAKKIRFVPKRMAAGDAPWLLGRCFIFRNRHAGGSTYHSMVPQGNHPTELSLSRKLSPHVLGDITAIGGRRSGIWFTPDGIHRQLDELRIDFGFCQTMEFNELWPHEYRAVLAQKRWRQQVKQCPRQHRIQDRRYRTVAGIRIRPATTTFVSTTNTGGFIASPPPCTAVSKTHWIPAFAKMTTRKSALYRSAPGLAAPQRLAGPAFGSARDRIPAT